MNETQRAEPPKPRKAMASQVAVVDIPSDPDDDDTAAAAAYPPALRKRSHTALAATSLDLLDFSPSPPHSKRRPPASPIVLDDTPTPPKRPPSAVPAKPVSGVAKTRQSVVPCSLGFRPDVAETPNSVLPCSSHFHAAVMETPGSSVPCSIGSDTVVAETPGFTSPRKFSGVSCPVSLDSDDELDDTRYRDQLIKVPSNTAKPEPVIHPCTSSYSAKVISATSTDQKDYLKSPGPQTTLSAHKNSGTTNFAKPLHADLPYENSTLWDADDFAEKHSLQEDKERKKDKNDQLIEERKEKQQEKKRLKKEEKARLIEERKQKREENKMQKEAMKVQLAEMKKLNKEKRKWESGKFASKSIIAEIDSTIAESGSIGGSLLTRFADKELKYRLTANSIKGSILWRMDVPKKIAQQQASVSEVPYILFVLQAEEFCDLVSSGSFFNHVHKVRTRYPTFTICYVINKLMSYIKKREQSQYKNPSNSHSWKRPPVEEVLCKLATHYASVHSRQCTDEAEVAEHVVGLTSSLANCKFRKPLTWLSVHANGASIPKGFIDKALVKKDNWLKSLIAIPKVQPRHVLAIWKKYRSMRSLLNVYMDPNKTVREKELLLQDLMLEDRLGDENRRFGEKCSSRVYRILMAQNGTTKVDDLEK